MLRDKKFAGAIAKLRCLNLLTDADINRIFSMQSEDLRMVLEAFSHLVGLWDPFNKMSVSPTRGHVEIAMRIESAMQGPFTVEDVGLEILIRNLICARTIDQRSHGTSIKDLFFYSAMMQHYFAGVCAKGDKFPFPRAHDVDSEDPCSSGTSSRYSSVPMLRFAPPAKSPPPRQHHTKQQALNCFVTCLGRLMLDPATVCYYLRPVENKLRELLGEEQLSNHVHAGVFRWEPFMGMHYPVPTKLFKAESYNHVLTRVLKALMKPYGLGRGHLKALGYIPKAIMSALLRQGFLVTEYATDSHFFLMHGKKTHPLQLLLIGVLLENNIYQIYYGDRKTLTVQDVLEELLKNDGLLWDKVLDAGAVNGIVGFSSAYYMHTFLMKHGDFYGLPELRAALLLSYLKTYRRCRAVHEKKFGVELSDAEFWLFMTLTRSNEVQPYGPDSVSLQPSKKMGVYFSKRAEQKSPHAILVRRDADYPETEKALFALGLSRRIT